MRRSRKPLGFNTPHGFESHTPFMVTRKNRSKRFKKSLFRSRREERLERRLARQERRLARKKKRRERKKNRVHD